VVGEFGDDGPDQKADRGQAAVDDGGRHRRGGDGLALLAGILRADVAVEGSRLKRPFAIGR
jgi:hypothetical protein